jgi:phenylpropionate dioxygenase-like ring-hydroxylating dioxygenase large terminal subunit
MLRFWHPVMPCGDVPKNRAVSVKLAGESLAIFRPTEGKLAAIADQCAHRRMKLSLGCVEAGRLVCPYHGWSFDPAGCGESPSAPKMQASIVSYDCAEAAGVVWIKGRESESELLAPDMPGWGPVGAIFSRIRAPLELVIDNFSEVEHTVATHPHFGFDRSQVERAICQIEHNDESVSVRNRGPAKMPPLDTRLVVGLRRGDYFHSDYIFRFDPPRSFVTHFWTQPETRRERMLKYHVHHYFVPEDGAVTRLVTFGFLNIQWPLFRRFGKQMGWLFRRKLRQTVEEDRYLLENLADQSPVLEGMKLSRFDSVLGLTRERLRRIYRNESAR